MDDARGRRRRRRRRRRKEEGGMGREEVAECECVCVCVYLRGRCVYGVEAHMQAAIRAKRRFINSGFRGPKGPCFGC